MLASRRRRHIGMWQVLLCLLKSISTCFIFLLTERSGIIKEVSLFSWQTFMGLHLDCKKRAVKALTKKESQRMHHKNTIIRSQANDISLQS